MSLFGDLERALAALYPFRVPLGIGVLIAVIGFLLIARRRGWQRIPRRHPRASIAVLVVVMAVGLPVGWVLGSPLFIRTELVEPGVGAPSATTVLRGEFSGADEFHTGSGQARILEPEPGRFVLSLEDFAVRNGPDLFVYLSPDPDGYADDATELGALKASDGSFSYDIPPGVDITAVRSVVIWCRAFSVLFATAPLGAA